MIRATAKKRQQNAHQNYQVQGSFNSRLVLGASKWQRKLTKSQQHSCHVASRYQQVSGLVSL
jgi:pyruvate/2-oxoglutarate/acetoin dehydrogenase E1 component